MTNAGIELGLTALGAMLSPTTLTFSVLVLVMGERPLRSGTWFYLGALGATLAIGVIAAFVLGNSASTSASSPKTWVCVLDIVLGVLALIYVVRWLRRPADPRQMAAATERMGKVASSPAVALLGAGATLANPGGFIVVALKDISQLNPSAGEYIAAWAGFALVSLLPLAVALVMLRFTPDRAGRVLAATRGWLDRHSRTVAAVIVILLAAALIRNGIAGLT